MIDLGTAKRMVRFPHRQASRLGAGLSVSLEICQNIGVLERFSAFDYDPEAPGFGAYLLERLGFSSANVSGSDRVARIRRAQIQDAWEIFRNQAASIAPIPRSPVQLAMF